MRVRRGVKVEGWCVFCVSSCRGCEIFLSFGTEVRSQRRKNGSQIWPTQPTHLEPEIFDRSFEASLKSVVHSRFHHPVKFHFSFFVFLTQGQPSHHSDPGIVTVISSPSVSSPLYIHPFSLRTEVSERLVRDTERHRPKEIVEPRPHPDAEVTDEAQRITATRAQERREREFDCSLKFGVAVSGGSLGISNSSSGSLPLPTSAQRAQRQEKEKLQV